MFWYDRISMRQYLLIGGLVIAVFALTLFIMGQAPICKCGYVKLWHGIVQSSENSQHISDWYSFSHIIHGFGFYALFWFLAGKLWRGRRPLGLMFLMALLAETSWEVFENTDFIINRYREVTISLDYYGDSVINSVADVIFMALGFFMAWRFPILIILALTAAMEVFVGYSIRDNLTLNIIMLIYPLEWIKIWQGV